MFEQDFDTKVQEVDNGYKAQMSELMEQNTELRKQYMKKCDELFTLTAKSDRQKKDELLTTKEAMMVKYLSNICYYLPSCFILHILDAIFTCHLILQWVAVATVISKLFARIWTVAIICIRVLNVQLMN